MGLILYSESKFHYFPLPLERYGRSTAHVQLLIISYEHEDDAFEIAILLSLR